MSISTASRGESGSLKIPSWLVLWNMAFIFPYIGKQKSQLTFIFFRGAETTNQHPLIKDMASWEYVF
jgi:hypothetical protein